MPKLDLAVHLQWQQPELGSQQRRAIMPFTKPPDPAAQKRPRMAMGQSWRKLEPARMGQQLGTGRLLGTIRLRETGQQWMAQMIRWCWW